MIILYLFISLFIGINIRVNVILGLVEALIVLALFIYRFRFKKSLLVLFSMGLGIGLSFIRPSYSYDNYQNVIVSEVKENYYIVSHLYEKLYVYEANHNHEVGDILAVKGEKIDFSFNKTESSFDFGEYLNKKGVYKRLVIKEKNVKFSNFIKINACKKAFLSHFDEDTKVMVQSILFGGGGSDETKELFQDLHLNRLISTSGIYLHFFDMVFMFLLSYLFKKEKYVKIGSALLLLFYSVFTFPRFVVIKFIFLKIIRLINEYIFKKKFSYLSLVSFSGILFLFIDYHYAYQDGFLLAYFIPLLALFVNGSFTRFKKFKRRLITMGIILISFVPFYLSFYHELSLLSPILQILLLPFLFVYLFLSILCFFRIPLYQGLNGFTAFFNTALKHISPFMIKIYAPESSGFFIFTYEIILIFLIYYISIGHRDIYKFLLTASLSIFTLYVAPIRPLVITSVSFIDVGQGDSCFIHQGTTSILIDTGGNIYTDLAKETLIPYLKKMQIYDIDLLITTHNDYDHMGAASSLIQNFKVKEYITSYEDFPLTIGNLTLINYNIYPDLWLEENDNSLVISFKIKEVDFLITGDAPKKIERIIIKDNPQLECDILKVGHHGSKTSTDSSFIEFLKPSEAVISVGRNNKYGHPHKEVLSILNRYKVKIRRTDLEGTIKYSFLF